MTLSKIARHTPVLTGEQKIRALSLDNALLPHVGDAITKLTNDWVWKEVGDSVEDIVDSMTASVESWYSDMLIGTVSTWLVNPPSGWLLLDGSTHTGADFPELFALLPAHLISGANFTLPDIVDAFSYGVIDEDNAGIVVGSNTLNLTVAQLPAHTHTYTPATVGVPAGPPPTTPVASVGTPTPTGSTGDSDGIDKRPLRFGLVFAVFAGR